MSAAPGAFALLDDGTPAALSRLYQGHVETISCTEPTELDAWAQAVQAQLAAGRHAVLLADYEWGARLQGLPVPGGRLRALVFEQLQSLREHEVQAWLAQAEGSEQPAPAGVLGLQPEPGTTRERFNVDMAAIHEAIAAGETYQVNHTYRLHGRQWGPPLALYRRLRAHQPVAYGALLRLPADEVPTRWVLSRSPELFVRHQAGLLTARPMKGTAQRHGAPEGDSETARLLHADTKNRAENLMIVDLLRNDLGRVAQVGSVQVPQLFAVEPYATVFQMTSTVTAKRRAGVGLAELLRALFPCGSITGAPKLNTMCWIQRLEATPRGLYTGAIGWLAAGEQGADCPDLCLSVAIRTLCLGGEPAADGTLALTLGVGGGIVQDSLAADEWAETQWKARFITRCKPGISLFETMRATSEGVALQAAHRARMQHSAQALGFAFDAAAFDAAVQAVLPVAGEQRRLKLVLGHDGGITTVQAPLKPLPAGPVLLRWASVPLPDARPLALHKTSDRAAYDQGVAEAEAVGAFDTLFCNAAGQVLEGGRSSLFAKVNGQWVTPPLSLGLLPGVMRAVLMGELNAVERALTRAEVKGAEALLVSNALRGALPAVLGALTALTAAAGAAAPNRGTAFRECPPPAALRPRAPP